MKPHRGLAHFDLISDAIERGDPEIVQAFERHLHYGYWSRPELAGRTGRELALAAERLTDEIVQIAAIRDGQRVLDVGCGVGGTVSRIDATYEGLDLLGINVNPRQLLKAKERLRGSTRNRVHFGMGTADRMPFAERSCDVITAIEVLLYCHRRARVFEEARRILRPGGRFVVADFLSSRISTPLFRSGRMMARYLPHLRLLTDASYRLEDYERMARWAGLRLIDARDLTAETLPSYPILHRLIASCCHAPEDRLAAEIHYRWGYHFSRWGWLTYQLLVFERLR